MVVESLLLLGSLLLLPPRVPELNRPSGSYFELEDEDEDWLEDSEVGVVEDDDWVVEVEDWFESLVEEELLEPELVLEP